MLLELRIVCFDNILINSLCELKKFDSVRNCDSNKIARHLFDLTTRRCDF